MVYSALYIPLETSMNDWMSLKRFHEVFPIKIMFLLDEKHIALGYNRLK